jgi:hypothetical protein
VAQGADRRQEALFRILRVDARFDGVAVDGQFVLLLRQRLAGGTRSCHSTRSVPVIISVTGCSTCRRVFISMK